MRDIYGRFEDGSVRPVTCWPICLLKAVIAADDEQIAEAYMSDNRTPEDVRERCRVELVARTL